MNSLPSGKAYDFAFYSKRERETKYQNLVSWLRRLKFDNPTKAASFHVQRREIDGVWHVYLTHDAK